MRTRLGKRRDARLHEGRRIKKTKCGVRQPLIEHHQAVEGCSTVAADKVVMSGGRLLRAREPRWQNKEVSSHSSVPVPSVRGKLMARRPYSWCHCAECASGGKRPATCCGCRTSVVVGGCGVGCCGSVVRSRGSQQSCEHCADDDDAIFLGLAHNKAS